MRYIRNDLDVDWIHLRELRLLEKSQIERENGGFLLHEQFGYASYFNQFNINEALNNSRFPLNVEPRYRADDNYIFPQRWQPPFFLPRLSLSLNDQSFFISLPFYIRDRGQDNLVSSRGKD